MESLDNMEKLDEILEQSNSNGSLDISESVKQDGQNDIVEVDEDEYEEEEKKKEEEEEEGVEEQSHEGESPSEDDGEEFEAQEEEESEEEFSEDSDFDVPAKKQKRQAYRTPSPRAKSNSRSKRSKTNSRKKNAKTKTPTPQKEKREESESEDEQIVGDAGATQIVPSSQDDEQQKTPINKKQRGQNYSVPQEVFSGSTIRDAEMEHIQNDVYVCSGNESEGEEEEKKGTPSPPKKTEKKKIEIPEKDDEQEEEQDMEEEEEDDCPNPIEEFKNGVVKTLDSASTNIFNYMCKMNRPFNPTELSRAFTTQGYSKLQITKSLSKLVSKELLLNNDKKVHWVNQEVFGNYGASQNKQLQNKITSLESKLEKPKLKLTNLKTEIRNLLTQPDDKNLKAAVDFKRLEVSAAEEKLKGKSSTQSNENNKENVQNENKMKLYKERAKLGVDHLQLELKYFKNEWKNRKRNVMELLKDYHESQGLKTKIPKYCDELGIETDEFAKVDIKTINTSFSK